MARINTEQLRNWQNGDVIPASDYNQERNLIITANNDTNDKANSATQNALNALERVNRLELQPTAIEETSIISRQTITLTEGQQVINIPEPGYLPNTNRIQVFIDGALTQVEETSATSVTLPSPAIADQQLTAVWYTELPRVFDLDRINDAIDNARTNWLEPVGVAGQLPYPAQEGDHCAVTSEEKVYRFQNGTWVYIMDAPNILDSGVPKVTQISRVHTATADQQIFAMPTNYDTQTDSAFVIRNTTFVPPSKYSLTSTTLTLTTPAKEGDEVIIIGYKAMPMGTDGSVSGLVIQPNTMPFDRVIGSPQILQDIQTNKASVADLEPKVAALEDKTSDLKTVKTNKDANGIFTTVTYRRKSDDTLHSQSVLSGGTTPNYTTRTVTYYETDGVTVKSTITYTLSYDTDGTLISEV